VTAETLSQNEIDLLFGGDADSPLAPAFDSGSDVRLYDFRRPARISKDRKRSLSAMYGLLAKAIESWLAGRVKDKIELELLSVDQLTFGEFVLALPSPSASFILDIAGSGAQGVIDIGHEFGYFAVDRFLGGTGPHAIPERAFTPLERLIVRIVADRLAFQLSEVWKDYVQLNLSISGFESIPEMLQVANREDPVLVANIGVTMGDLTSLILVCLPFLPLEKFFTGTSSRRMSLAKGSEDELRQDRNRIEASLRTARIEVSARLPRFEVNLAELAGLEPGKIIATGLPPTTDLEIYVSGQRRFAGAPGRVEQKLAVRVVHEVQPEPENLIQPERGRQV